jgi:dethiobiotin synthetase
MITSAFIAGTDTEVGKTVITCGLLRALIGSGRAAIGMKPVATGAESTSAGLRNDDALQLIANSKPTLSYPAINPCVYKEAASPNIAASRMGQEVKLDVIEAAYRLCRAQAEIVLVEGIGGWRVPLSDVVQTVDLVRLLQLPVILVCGMRLGCINHALLSAAAIVGDGVRLIGWVANAVDPGYRYQTETIDILRKGIPAPLLGVTAWYDPFDGDAVAAALGAGRDLLLA